jgi:hypothetical protein
MHHAVERDRAPLKHLTCETRVQVRAPRMDGVETARGDGELCRTYDACAGPRRKSIGIKTRSRMRGESTPVP